MASPSEQIQHRHAYRNPIGHLVQYQRTTAICDFRRDFNAAIHWSRMHDDRVRSGAFEMASLQTIMNGVLPHRGKERRVLSLALNAQDHDYVCALERVFETLLNAQAIVDDAGKLMGHEGSWPTNADR